VVGVWGGGGGGGGAVLRVVVCGVVLFVSFVVLFLFYVCVCDFFSVLQASFASIAAAAKPSLPAPLRAAIADDASRRGISQVIAPHIHYVYVQIERGRDLG